MLEADGFKMRAGVLELIAGIAVSGVEGAWGTGIRHEHPEDLKRRRHLSRGIKAEAGGAEAYFDIEVNMEFGRDFVAVAGALQSAVAEAVSTMTGWEVTAVNVYVVGVNTP